MSFKLLVALAAAKGWHLHHVDITTAFLNAELKVAIFINLPGGLDLLGTEKDQNPCGQLVKTLYGLKQVPREWLCPPSFRQRHLQIRLRWHFYASFGLY